ncbi:diacylglycerol kinase [Chloropicon primus]|uniref:Diacylglycerol kinase n=2 Tax=Chloropicon primus TaxID=1764295 RepID=A0A5B8MGE2_9CHLO|nr:diacylglycerol kinase [Chloropicon primus]UPQ98699.1 diacylglycerol kinase [Chloropicon primus]|eukprot:QDZ19489.1 diacylglycerol kinase [Chloropicon primus]
MEERGVNCTFVLENFASCTVGDGSLDQGGEVNVTATHAGSLVDVIVPPMWVTLATTVTIVVAILTTRWLFAKTVKRVWVFENLERSRHRRLILPPSAVRRPKELERQKKRSKLTYTSLSARGKALLTPKKKREGGEGGGGATPAGTNGSAAAGAERPIIDAEALPSDFTPLIVFVNRKSGGQKGAFLYEELSRNLNPHQVFDLAVHNPERILKIFSDVPNVKVLVCGGDGTIQWILNTIEGLNLRNGPIPVAVLPLGTGNDLARVLGWGRGFNMDDNIPEILVGVKDAHITLLDRWEIEVANSGRATRKASKAAPSSIIFNNYFGIGVDATTALRFHQTRDQYPEWFFSRLTNKLWYVLHGAREIVDRSCAGLASKMRLVCDGEEVDIPSYAEGIILLNVNSFAGGVKMWNDRAGSQENLHRYGTFQSFGRSSMHDGMLDVVAVNGSLHLGEMNVGLSRPTQLCQGKEITIEMTSPMAMQVDGEPWTQKPCQMTISHKSQAHMLRKTVDTNGEAALRMQELLTWASDRRVLGEDQYQALLKEMSRRFM